jgi:hypothetical protein
VIKGSAKEVVVGVGVAAAAPAETGIVAAVGVDDDSVIETVGVIILDARIGSVSMGEGITSMASPDCCLDRPDCPRDILDPRREIAGESGAGRVDVNDGEGGFDCCSIKDDAGVLNSDVPGDDEARDGAKVALPTRDGLDSAVSGQDAGVTNGDDEDEWEGDGAKVGMIIGVGFIAVKEDVEETSSDLESITGWVSQDGVGP